MERTWNSSRCRGKGGGGQRSRHRRIEGWIMDRHSMMMIRPSRFAASDGVSIKLTTRLARFYREHQQRQTVRSREISVFNTAQQEQRAKEAAAQHAMDEARRLEEEVRREMKEEEARRQAAREREEEEKRRKEQDLLSLVSSIQVSLPHLHPPLT